MRQDAVGVELWGAVVWLAAGLVALLLPMVVATPMASIGPALFETLFGLPLAAWLALLAARALNCGNWTVFGDHPVAVDAAPSTFWAFTAVAVMIAGVFLAGFVRGLLSLLVLA